MTRDHRAGNGEKPKSSSEGNEQRPSLSRMQRRAVLEVSSRLLSHLTSWF